MDPHENPTAKILVVDDSAMDRKVAGGFVTEAGFEAFYAESGQDALDHVERDAPDIVLTDLRMPGMDGLQLVTEMRASHPDVPVILMTAHGSEETAVAALRAGAANYVPKTELWRDLAQAIQVVHDAMLAARGRAQVRDLLQEQSLHYVVGCERGTTRALVGHLQEALRQGHLCEETDLIRVGTALTEALANARDHGNLELDSTLRAPGDGSYSRLRLERMAQAPYCERRVHVHALLTATEATFTVRDEGRGFDVTQLPDPRDPANLLKPSGRGIVLIRTFMDEVTFNEQGNEIRMVMRPDPDSD
ncbi:MAG: response regulator [Planctomycetota bacterium]|nr:response regulator [Planctomycetota bacterium]